MVTFKVMVMSEICTLFFYKDFNLWIFIFFIFFTTRAYQMIFPINFSNNHKLKTFGASICR